MRVIFLSHYFVGYREPVLKALMSSKVLDVFFCADKVSNSSIPLLSSSSPIYGSRFYEVRNFWFKNRFLWQSNVFKVLRKVGPRSVVVVGDPNFITVWLLLIYGRIFRVRVFLWTHGFIDRGGRTKILIKLIMYRLSAGLFLYGENSRQELLECGLSKNKTHVIYNSLDYSRQLEQRKQLVDISRDCLLDNKVFANDGFTLIFVGRLTSQKKLQMCIEALFHIKNLGITVNMIFVGDGDLRARLNAHSQELKVEDQVHFVGACHEEATLARYMMFSDACVAPGEIGLTAMHAMAYGVPCITHDDPKRQMPEYEAIVPGRTGELFCEGSVSSLAFTILKLRKNTKAHYSKNCIDVIERSYNVDYQVGLIEKVICS